jgi:hypothetical protein
MCLCLLALKVDACASEHDILWTVRGGRTGCLGACVNVRKVAITDMFTYTHTTHTLQAYKQTNKQIHAYTHARTDNGTIQACPEMRTEGGKTKARVESKLCSSSTSSSRSSQSKKRAVGTVVFGRLENRLAHVQGWYLCKFESNYML